MICCWDLACFVIGVERVLLLGLRVFCFWGWACFVFGVERVLLLGLSVFCCWGWACFVAGVERVLLLGLSVFCVYFCCTCIWMVSSLQFVWIFKKEHVNVNYSTRIALSSLSYNTRSKRIHAVYHPYITALTLILKQMWTINCDTSSVILKQLFTFSKCLCLYLSMM